MDVRIPETPPPPLSANLLPPPPLSADVFYEQPLNVKVNFLSTILLQCQRQKTQTFFLGGEGCNPAVS